MDAERTEANKTESTATESTPTESKSDIREMLREVITEYFNAEKAKPASDPDELAQEQNNRAGLEQQLQQLMAEARSARERAEEAERNAMVRAELQRAGVSKLDLAYRAIKDEIHRDADGKFVAQGGSELREHVARFVAENPELLPARLAGGSGASQGHRNVTGEARVELETIRPGMSPEELERVRLEIARVASQTLRGM